MINITSALFKLRHAHKIGKISAEVQARTLRRLGHAGALAQGERIKIEHTVPSADWSAMMGLLASIEIEIAPIIEAKRKAERDCFDVRYADDGKRRVAKVAKAAKAAPVVAPAPVKVDYTCTPAWWKEQELVERNEKKAQRQACKAQGMTKEQATAAIAEFSLA